MLADSNRSTIFTAAILLVVMSIAATRVQHANAQTAHAAGSADMVDANGDRVGKL